MTIYAADGTVKYSVEGYNEGSKLYKQLMSHDYVVLPFTLETPFVCEIGDYMIDPQFGRYELVDEYMPIFNTNTACYDYKLRLDAYYYRWKNKLLKYSPTSGSELAFTLTSTIATHANIVLDNLAQLGYTYWGDNSAFVVDFDETIDTSVAKPIQYQNVKITAALTLIAQAFECEWWVTENIIHFGHCEETNAGDTLEIGVNVSEMSSSDSTTEFITRLYAFGSTRNLPRDYKKSEETDIVKDGIIQKRLMLPHWSDLEGKDERQMLVDNGYSLSDQFGYIDVLDKLDTMESGDPKAVEGVLIIDDVYPRTQCHVNNVETYTKPIEDEDGNPTGETQTFYKLYDDSGLHFDSDYILPNSDGLMMKFTSGKLNGMEFECIYNDDEGFYEPIVNENYGRTLPDNILNPEVGNTFVLYNWDTSRLPETGLITNASLELLRKAIEYLNEARKDSKTYTCTEECFEDDYTIREIGSAVTLVNPSYFEGERASRILGLEVNLDLPYDHPKYTCGEKAKYNVIDNQNQKIESITLNGASYTGTGTGIGGGSSIYLIKTNDATRPTNTNTFSALMALEEFLSAKGEDTAKGVITFVKGLWVKAKGLFGIDEEGNGIFNTLSALSGIINSLQSGNYDGDGTAGAGWQITNDDGNGNSRLTIDNLYVRMKAIFNVLEVRKMVHTAGNYIFSPAGSVIELVDYLDAEGNVLGYEAVKVPWVLRLVPLTLREKLLSRTKLRKVNTLSNADKAKVATFRCWVVADDGTTKTINTWQTGYLARCETFNVKGDDTQKHDDNIDNGIINETGVEGKATGNTFYWRKVTGVGESERLHVDDGKVHNYVELSNTTGEYYPGSDWPSAGDSIVCYGVADASLREYSNLVIIETVGGDAPAIKEYLGIGLYDDGTAINWSLTGKMRTKISPRTGNVFYGDFRVSTGSGYTDINTLIDDMMSEFEVTIDGITATVKRILSNNILTGVLDGNGWIGENNTPAVVTSDNGIYGSGNKLYSPYLSLDKHKQYVVSFYRNRDGDSLKVYVNNGTDQDWANGRFVSQEEVTVHEANETARGLQRYYFTIGQPAESGYTWIYFEGVTSTYPIYYPQIEEGTEMSPFSASGIEIGSRITQTSDEIRSEVSNGLSGLSTTITQQAGRITAVVNDVNGVKDGLSATGIDIQNREITMTADKFTLNNNDGEQVLGTDANGNLDVTGIVHANGGEFTGTIHATDGEFTGTVHAKLMYSDIKIITDTYTVVPGEQPYTFYLIRLNRGGTVPITLPDPTVYEGLEMSFFQPPYGETRLSEGGKAILGVENPSTTRIISTGGQRSMFGYSTYEWLYLEDINTSTAYTITEGHLITVKAIDGNWRVVSHVRERYGGPCITKSKEYTITANTTLAAIDMPYFNIFQFKVNSAATLTLPVQGDIESAFGWTQGSLPTNFVYRFTIVVNYASSATLTVKGSNFKDNNGNDITSHQMAKGDTAEILCSMCNGFHYQLLWYSK